MYSREREFPGSRRNCSGGSTHLFPYAPAPETAQSRSPLMRTYPDYGQNYDTDFYTSISFGETRFRGCPDRTPPRPMFPGMDATVMSPVRTVPTSITIPPSRQKGHRPLPELKTEAPGPYLPFHLSQNGPPPQSYPPGGDPGHVGVERPTGVPLPSQRIVQKICALLTAHCRSCSGEGCSVGEACVRVRGLWRHISQCKLQEHCPEYMCYPVKKVLAHFWSCSEGQCPVCSPLRMMVKDARSRLAVRARVKSEPDDVTGGGYLFPQENPISPSPVRKFHHSPGLDAFTKRQKSDFEPETALFSAAAPPPTNGAFFADPAESFPAEALPSQPPPDQNAFQLGTSLFETFNPQEIETYLRAVRECDMFPSKPDPELKDGICAVCLNGEQTFQPIQLYCDCCFARIKRGGMYWKSIPEAKVQICACPKCFAAKKNGQLVVGQLNLPQHVFRSCKNDECVTETWVACDKCGYWVHSSCGLFNRGENNEKAKYMCPFCLKEEMELGHRTRPLTKPVSMWGADELMRCSLSDFIQSRLNDQIFEEMVGLHLPERACPPLTVCILMSTRKTTKVQRAVATSFPELPAEYPYQQKVIGVFQKIHGVDVLLFCMYVQEYGDDCPRPNQRWINLEYIDSVKHFIPDLKTARGEPLRSIVYKETLLAYIEFVKRRGFEVFYIWACPPGKEGEDYILHCKPKTQRIPSADRLRGWYKDLLKTAKERKIVTHDSNLMDTFFTCGMDRAVGRPFSAAEMPYFEGDYWPGEAEKILKALRLSKGIDPCRKPGEKRKTRAEMSLNESLENGLMVSLPFPRWSDFMVWHLQEPCSLCQTYISSGQKYVYHFHASSQGQTKQAENSRKRAHFEGIKLGRTGASHSDMQFFQICQTCYQTCAAIGEGGPIPDCIRFSDLEQEYVAPTAPIVGEFPKGEESRFSEIFESRQAFLAFCKGNHYQFDTLQHAKHSSMMLLYHLHNTKAPVFPTLCRGCGIEMPSAGEKPVEELCRMCRTNSALYGGTPAASFMTTGLNNRLQIMRVTENFEHAAHCRLDPCIPDCRRMKELFKHARNCKIGVVGSCRACRYYALFVERHAHFCNRPCLVPDCERIKAVRKHRIRLDQAQRSRGYFGEASGSSSSS